MNRRVCNASDQHDRSQGAIADVCEPERLSALGQQRAVVIVNADDWGCRATATDCILDCFRHRALSSVSAMVFMEDSVRAADLAREHAMDAGLHLNFTAPFTGNGVPSRLIEEQQKLTRFLRSHRYAPVLFNPLLVSSFEFVVQSQLDEFERLYGALPGRIDGHHHMHLCMNVLLQRLFPEDTIVRRNFSFAQGDKGGVNRWYRKMQDALLARRYRATDYFFDMRPMDSPRLARILELGRQASVEIEAHPERPEEYAYLMDGELLRCAEDVEIERGYLLHRKGGRSRLPLRQPVVSAAESEGASDATSLPHICVCICTYKRPEPLKRLLRDLNRQRTNAQFTYSIVVTDNDPECSAKSAVAEVRALLSVPLKYCVEPNRSIARARNCALANAEGDYLALIDDDEFPVEDWLLTLLTTCRRYGVDGVLGPVKRYFEHEPPRWLKKSSLYDRRVHPTGMQVKWKGARTGNVLMNRSIVADEAMPFRPEFRAGEDQDFFRRKIAEGYRFVWSAEAVAYEVIPETRWKRMYYVRKAVLQGATAAQHANYSARMIVKSAIAVPLYAILLPIGLIAGQHRFMTLLVKLCDHGGKLLQSVHMNPIREEYVSE